MSIADFWKLLSGIGIFLFGMFQLEESLKQLAGRTFKLFLRKHTENKLSAIFSGTLVTGLLQSSSVVTLMAMSFVGAGVINMRNALAVVFGSNLGTTISSWMVATIGFKFNIEIFYNPIIALSGIGLIGFTNNKKIYQISNFCMGFGLLFLGLGFIKESIGVLVNNFDFTPYIHLNIFTFVLIGFLITAIIQSSSATMAITLSALNANIIPFDTSVAVIIGSELGTSTKIALGSIGAVVAKKRVAFGNIIFNIVITLFSFILMYPIISLIKVVLGVEEALIGLALFQTFINLFGILLFYPFIKQFGDFLEKIIKDKEKSATYFIQNTNPLITELAIEVIEKETLLFIHRVIHLNLEAFEIDTIELNCEDFIDDANKKISSQVISYSEKYDKVKHAEGEIVSLYTKISEEKIEKEDFIRLNQLISSVRNAMYSAKGIKNIDHDRRDLSESVVDTKYEHYIFLQKQIRDFYLELNKLLKIKEQSLRFSELKRLMDQIQKEYNVRLNNIYKHSEKNTLDEIDISTLLNVSREVYSSCKAILYSLKDYLLDAKNAEDFDNSPIVILN